MKLTVVVIVLLVSAFFRADAQNTSALAGRWRGEFAVRENLNVPFNFEINRDGSVYLLNADEKFPTGTFSFKKDSIFIPLDQFDNELALQIRTNILTGELRKQDHTGQRVAVRAERNKHYRFVENKKLKAKNIAGSYEIEFTFESGKTEKSVAVLKQDGKKLTGTFLKESGDARYLEGITEGNNFYLSSFIGSTPGYYTGRIGDDGSIAGEQVGTRVRNPFKGRRNDSATLPNPYTESPDNERPEMFSFSFPDIQGNVVSLLDPKYQNKVVVVPITGTWCPNCVDEAAFLAPWFKENHDRGVEIITIHYERQTDTAYYRKVMTRFRKRFDIRYDQLFGGLSNSDSVRTSLGIPGFKAFPTTIFIDKKGRIAKMHSGYSGPATGRFYDEFMRDFNAEVNKLLDE